uniref:Putative reverse transcriptase n=1 Tax=Compsopogon caeruleus TaxID=31354 RepID=A0A1Z1XB11_9RHOD|nr:putative reverse transcriptase [Compsopogon caeruleus]ARX96050.1 putative reverse transcriptase [Compsopogon caeruleus]
MRQNLIAIDKKILAVNLNLNSGLDIINRVWDKKNFFSINLDQSVDIVDLIIDLSKQMMVKLVLEPEWEAKFEISSYGYRPGKSTKDIIKLISDYLKNYPSYVTIINLLNNLLEVNNSFLLHRIDSIPIIQLNLENWLQLGILKEYYSYAQTFELPKIDLNCISILSPLLINIIFYDIHSYLQLNPLLLKNIFLIRYSHIILIMNYKKTLVVQAIKDIKSYITYLSNSTHNILIEIYHTTNGFDFLGYNIRTLFYYDSNNQQISKCIITPCIQSIKLYIQGNRELIQNFKSNSIEQLIKKLSSRLIKWGIYYNTCDSQLTFKNMDRVLFSQIKSLIARRHSNKSRDWLKKKYFPDNYNYYIFNNVYNSSWVLTSLDTDSSYKVFLPRMQWIPQCNYIAVSPNKSPYDGDYIYWRKRRKSSL